MLKQDPVLHGDQALLDYFREGDFAYTLRGWRADAAAYFGRSAAAQEILGERLRWLTEARRHHLVHTDGADPFVREAAAVLERFAPGAGAADGEGGDLMLRLGVEFEPDLLVLSPDADGHMVLRAGAVCWPSHWAPEEKGGLRLRAIHDVVPTLNPALGDVIERFLERVPADQTWHRINFGLAATGERNQHPARGLPRLTAATPPQEVWLRMEYQALIALPRTGGVLFGIRVASFRLGDLQGHACAPFLAHQLRTMPEVIQGYKGIAAVAQEVAGFLA